MNNFEKFLNKQKPARKNKSKLEPFTNNILFLKNKGYTYQQIIDYLQMEEINVSYTALRSFVIKKLSSQESSTDSRSQVANKEVEEDKYERPTEQDSSEAPTLTDKNPSQSKAPRNEDVPADRRFPPWSNLPSEYKSIDDLI